MIHYKKQCILIFVLLLTLRCQENSVGNNNSDNNNPPVNNNTYLGQIPPDSTVKVFAPQLISTDKFEFSLVVHPNQKQIFFTRFDETNSIYSTYSTNEIDSIWTQPKKVFIGNYTDLLSAVSLDGNTLYIYSNRPTQTGSGTILTHSDIWSMRKEGLGWNEMQNIGLPVNTNLREMSPSISGNNHLFYSSIDSNYNSQIKYSTYLGGTFSDPNTLGSEINNSKDAHNPCVAPDESYLIFTSYRLIGLGNADLYISFQGPDGTWTPAKNMGTKINSSSQDDYATVSPDGKYLFFASDRNSSGYCDIFWISTSIIEKLK